MHNIGKGEVREHRHMSQELMAHIPIELEWYSHQYMYTSSKLYLNLTARGCTRVYVERIGCNDKLEMQTQQGNHEVKAILQLDAAGSLCVLIGWRE